MSILRRFLRLVGIRPPERPSQQAEAQQRWQRLLERYQGAQNQVREAATPDELAVAHAVCQAALAEVEWHIRLAKQDLGLPVRPVAENQRAHEEMIHGLRAGSNPPTPGRRRWRRLRRGRSA